MRIYIITVLPELLESPFGASILKRAIERGLVAVHTHNLRDYATNKYKQVDDYQFGGGAGMVLMAEPLDRCLQELTADRDYDEVIYMTPDGTPLNQKMANKLSLTKNLLVICGHYKGIDQRIRDLWVTREISMAKLVAGQLLHKVADGCLQMHGGMGITDELDIGHYAKRLMMINATFGNGDYHQAQFNALRYN